jgi:hypothetical protein
VPNWCMNRLTIRDTDTTLSDMLAQVTADDEGHPQLLRSWHPMPAELVGTASPPDAVPQSERARLAAAYGSDNWYDWANSAHGWGTKWADCGTVQLDRSDGQVVFAFDTAWGPPLYGLLNISVKWPTAAFLIEYVEPGGGFSGDTMISAGTFIHDHDYPGCTSPFAIASGWDDGDDDGDDGDRGGGRTDDEGSGTPPEGATCS